MRTPRISPLLPLLQLLLLLLLFLLSLLVALVKHRIKPFHRFDMLPFSFDRVVLILFQPFQVVRTFVGVALFFLY